MGLKSFLYKALKYSNDAKAITSGSPKKMSKRIGRRVTGKAAGKGIRKLFK